MIFIVLKENIIERIEIIRYEHLPEGSLYHPLNLTSFWKISEFSIIDIKLTKYKLPKADKVRITIKLTDL